MVIRISMIIMMMMTMMMVMMIIPVIEQKSKINFISLGYNNI